MCKESSLKVKKARKSRPNNMNVTEHKTLKAVDEDMLLRKRSTCENVKILLTLNTTSNVRWTRVKELVMQAKIKVLKLGKTKN